MRCAGYDRVDLSMAESLGIVVLRVPAYSPHSVAEHAVALMMALNRQIVKASARVAQGRASALVCLHDAAEQTNKATYVCRQLCAIRPRRLRHAR
mmetsp:Transcript_8576/g.28127  ORF Transcript_8576/g.28127 Transcript_8576/m.28127 type:complete len:95 (-) Transcript_8576:804-1088(-)